MEHKRKWTMTNGKTRDAGTGPWVAGAQVQQFLEFCVQNGHKTRDHSDIFVHGYQIYHNGHWMALIWNKSFMRYTADRRLSLIVQSFAAEKTQTAL